MSNVTQKDIQNAVFRALSRMGLARADQRADSTETAAFARELEFVRANVYRTLYPNLVGRDLVPDGSEAVPAWADSHTWTEVKESGEAAIFGQVGRQVPFVEMTASQDKGIARTIVAGYKYDRFELERAKQLKAPLATIKPEICREIIETRLDKLICLGDAGLGMPGFLNQATGGAGQIAAPLAWADWSNPATTIKTMIETNLGAAYDQIFGATNGIFGDQLSLVVPSKVYSALNKVRDFGGGRFTTMAKIIMAETPWLAEIVHSVRLNAVTGSGKDRSILYAKTNKVLEKCIVADFTQLTPQSDELEMRTTCFARYAGMRIQHPGAIAYCDHP